MSWEAVNSIVNLIESRTYNIPRRKDDLFIGFDLMKLAIVQE